MTELSKRTVEAIDPTDKVVVISGETDALEMAELHLFAELLFEAGAVGLIILPPGSSLELTDRDSLQTIIDGSEE